MKRVFMLAAAALALAACSTPALQHPTTPASAPTASASLHVAPLVYHMRVLPNGLRVYALPDPNTANVSVQVWYNVGSKYDPPGRSGFAHLFEHIMFKATKDLPPESFDRLTEDVGGFNNASTYDDFTNYYEVVPANYLQPILWAEAERMGSLVIDQATFNSERSVVEEELRQRVLAAPYGRLFYLDIAQANFSVHPYGRPGIGSIADLDAATVEDVQRFHATYYRPDNAVLVVAGNFDEAQFNQWVDQYFGPIVKPGRDIPRISAVEPTRAQGGDYAAYAPNVPLPAVTISYPQPRSTSPDIPVLAVLDDIMATGQSSRLYHGLVYDQRVATQVFSNFEVTQDPGAYTLAAVLSEGKTPDSGLAALEGEIARVRDQGVTEAELDKAKNRLLTTAIENRETAYGRASEIAEAAIRFGDAAHADQYLAAIQAVTIGDVQRVARQIFDDSRRVVIRYQDESKRAPGAPGQAIVASPHIQATALTIADAEVPSFALAPAAQRQRPPAPAAPVSARIPEAASRTLDNGLRVIVAPNHALPLISADLRFDYGDAADPAGRAGLSQMTADLVAQGTITRSATDIAQGIESIGANLAEDSGPDASSVSLQTRADRANVAFSIMADIVRNPTFANDELERVRQQTLDGLQVSLSDPGEIAGFAMTRAIYGDGPYGQTASPRSLRAITRDDVNRFHGVYWRPDAGVLVISGDVTPEQGFAMAETYFGDWTKPAATLPSEPDASVYSATPRTILVDVPGAGQAAVAMGLRGIARRDGDYFPLLVANAVLGGGYSARLNEEVRIKRGLSYGAFSSVSARLAPGPIVASAQTRNDAAVQVYQLIAEQIDRIGHELAPGDELTARKASLIGSFGRTVETTAGVASAISTLSLYGLPPEALATYTRDVSNVTAAQARDVAARYYDPARANLVIAGDASHFDAGLRRLRHNVERIPVSQLNLDSAALH